MGNQILALRRMIHSEPDPELEPESAGHTGDTGPEPQAAPETPAAAPGRPLHLVLAVPPTGHAHHMLMSTRDYLAALRRQVKAKRDAPGGIGAWLDNGHAPTNREQREYAHKRAWVTPGDEGGWCEMVGVAYYATLGKAVPALCNATGWIFARMLRAAIACSITYLLALVAVFTFAGTVAGFAMIAILAALAAAGWGLAEAAAAAKRKVSVIRPPSPATAADGATDTDEDPQWDQ